MNFLQQRQSRQRAAGFGSYQIPGTNTFVPYPLIRLPNGSLMNPWSSAVYLTSEEATGALGEFTTRNFASEAAFRVALAANDNDPLKVFGLGGSVPTNTMPAGYVPTNAAARDYVTSSPDLVQCCSNWIYQPADAFNHYLNHGINEGRHWNFNLPDATTNDLEDFPTVVDDDPPVYNSAPVNPNHAEAFSLEGVLGNIAGAVGIETKWLVLGGIAVVGGYFYFNSAGGSSRK